LRELQMLASQTMVRTHPKVRDRVSEIALNEKDNENMKFNAERRGALTSFGAGVIASWLSESGSVNAALPVTLAPDNAKNLRELLRMLAGIPRRRDFKTVPMILDDPDLWDAASIAAVLAYTGGPKQAWDNTDLAGSWLNGMRNSMNVQIWSFKQPNFLCVSATHGLAHLALFDQDMWDKYQLAKWAGGNITRNAFVLAPPAFSHCFTVAPANAPPARYYNAEMSNPRGPRSPG
jgi:hypothetical protein